jgi:hypothetical protein
MPPRFLVAVLLLLMAGAGAAPGANNRALAERAKHVTITRDT